MVALIKLSVSPVVPKGKLKRGPQASLCGWCGGGCQRLKALKSPGAML
jgi:hypothetical protein